jgi:hypothetical protein
MIMLVKWLFICIFTSIGPGAIGKVNGIMNCTKYQGILAKNLVARPIFQFLIC